MPRAAPIALAAVLSAIALTAHADNPPYYANVGVAIDGYDTVAYFSTGRAVSGQPEIEVEWKGAVWRFASERNRDMFEMNPRAYAPRFGGYCAYALSRGYVDSPDPQAWKIVDGKLYLTHSPSFLDAWLQDITGNIELGEANWPAILRD